MTNVGQINLLITKLHKIINSVLCHTKGIKADLLVVVSPQSGLGPPAGEQGQGGAEEMARRMVRDRTTGLLGTSSTTTQTLQLH